MFHVVPIGRSGGFGVTGHHRFGHLDVLAHADRNVAGHRTGQTAKIQRQHIEVAEAVMARDAEAATAAYRHHMEHVRDSTIQSMAEMRSS